MSTTPLGGRRVIPEGWRLVTLDEIKSDDPDACRAGPFGSSISRKFFVEFGVPVIRGNNLTMDLTQFVADGFVFVSEERTREKYSACIARPGDLVFTCWGSIGQVGRIPGDGPYPEYVISNKQLKLRVHPRLADSRFVFYYVASTAGVEYIKSRSIGAAVPGINLGIMKSIPIALPSLEVQRGIVDALSTYDDLIENNRRRIQLLEQAARLLYKEWFVHLRFPGHEDVKVVDGVPQGWTKGAVADFYDTASGGTPSRKNPDFFTGDINWVKTQELQDGYIFSTDEKITEEAISRSSAKVFPANSVLLAMYGATIGQVGLLARSSACNQACCALLPKAAGTSHAHAFFFLLENRDSLRKLGQGAAQRNISQQVVRSFGMSLPTKPLLDSFLDVVLPVLEQIKTLQASNHQLEKARDLLLPRLMNGEIKV